MYSDTKHIQIRDYNYPLPDHRIAKYPLAQRDQSKLLLYRQGQVSEDTFRNLPQYLPQGELMVFNNTRVIQARMHFRKETGAQIEVFCLEPALPVEYQENFTSRGQCEWYCLVGNLKKWKEGKISAKFKIQNSEFKITEAEFRITAERIGVHGTSQRIRFTWEGDLAFSEVLDAMGELPIPPYLNRDTEESDLSTYQTVYSKIEGSVAAPTAGLHFTDSVLAALDARGIDREEVTLHVGAGTFKPVKSEDIGGHDMHTEHIAVRRQTVEKLLVHQGHATAVGTTSVRTLESLYYMGVLSERLNAKNEKCEDGNALHISQWFPYEYAQEGHQLTTMQALQALLCFMNRHGMEVLQSSTQIIIAPGYEYHIVHRIITNFHQPQSTLLLLVSAFVQGRWRTIYDYALAHDFRFLSYGDSSMLEPPMATGTEAEEQCEPAQEMFPVVDEMGNIIDAATRAQCHGGSMLLHPVVHLHVFNSQGDLYLQKRPMWKDIQPGRWDTAVGGHVDLGESVDMALRREASEELGITDFEPEAMTPYVFQSSRERELVYPHRCTYDDPIHPSAETDGGRFWTTQEIQEALNQGVLTPNFESEYQKLFGEKKL